MAKIKLGLAQDLRMGNLDSKRDWGFAGDYVEAMWLMLQHPKPEDFVVATGETYSVRRLLEVAFSAAGMELVWEGKGVEEKGIDKRSRKVVVSIDPALLRPAEVDLLIGRPDKAKKMLGWSPRMSFEGLVNTMVCEDLARLGGK